MNGKSDIGGATLVHVIGSETAPAILRVLHTAIFISCTSSLWAAPAITGVTNSASNIPPGLPNYGLAQGSIFAVYGSGLGPATLVQATAFPLPSTQGLAGTTVTVNVNGVTESCIMFYTVASQVAALLPSATPVGSGTLTVSWQGQSASIPVQVTGAGFGTYTLNESGTGPAVVTDAFYNVITMVNPAHPGQTLILWGTGLGPVSGDETEPPVQVNLNTGVQIYVENQPATVLYGGRSGDPGLDQINFIVPTGTTGGCRTSIAVREKGVTGNVTTMAVAPAGQTTCGDALGLLTSSNLQKAMATGTLNTAAVTLYRFGSDSDTLAADFDSYPVASLVRSYGGSLGASAGSCTAYESQGSAVITDPIQPLPLDAGPSLMLTGPAGAKTIPASSTGSYSSVLGAASSYIQPGNYTAANGNGGAAVPAFNWNLTLPTPISLTNLPAVINRSQDLTVTWNNSAAFPFVSIFGVSGVPQSSGQTNYVQFYCTVPGSGGQFTIPSVILGLIPGNGYGAIGQPGVLMEIAGIASDSESVAGIDAAIFDAFTYNGKVVGVQ